MNPLSSRAARSPCWYSRARTSRPRPRRRPPGPAPAGLGQAGRLRIDQQLRLAQRLLTPAWRCPAQPAHLTGVPLHHPAPLGAAWGQAPPHTGRSQLRLRLPSAICTSLGYCPGTAGAARTVGRALGRSPSTALARVTRPTASSAGKVVVLPHHGREAHLLEQLVAPAPLLDPRHDPLRTQLHARIAQLAEEMRPARRSGTNSRGAGPPPRLRPRPAAWGSSTARKTTSHCRGSSRGPHLGQPHRAPPLSATKLRGPATPGTGTGHADWISPSVGDHWGNHRTALSARPAAGIPDQTRERRHVPPARRDHLDLTLHRGPCYCTAASFLLLPPDAPGRARAPGARPV